MFENLCKYVAEACEEAIQALTVEDLALWVLAVGASGTEDGGGRTAVDRVKQVWLVDSGGAEQASEGSRQQPLLRALIDALEADGVSVLTRDEVDFLLAIFELMQEHPERFARPRSILSPYLDGLQGRRDALEPAPDMAGLGKRVCIATPDELRRSRMREVRSLAGIDMPLRGPVWECKGDVKVLECVPANCTVVAQQGSCYVNGFVLGRVVATHHCEVRENISGVVIASEGHIRTRNIINHAVVVAKAGAVRCRQAQDPQLLFAGDQVWVAGTITSGSYVSPCFRVGGEVQGGVVHVSESLAAKRFALGRAGTLTIVLRDGLSCVDYGEQLTLEARGLLTQYARLYRRLCSLNHLVALADREADHYASCAVTFLCGGEQTRTLLQQVQAAQLRLAFLDRLLAGMHTLNESVSARATSGEGAAMGTSSVSQADSISAIREVEAELKELESEGDIDPEFAREREEIIAAGLRLLRKASTPEEVRLVCQRLKDKETAWFAKRQELQAKVDELEKQLRETTGRLDAVDAAMKAGSKTQVLMRLLELAKERPAEDALAVRAGSPFARLMLRSIRKRRQHVNRYQEMALPVRAELRQIGTQLRSKCQILTREPEEQAIAAEATGCFERGVRLCIDASLAQESNPPCGTVVIADDTGDDVATYMREGRYIVKKSG